MSPELRWERQGREKPVKKEQKKVGGPELGPQVEQTMLLASPVYVGQAQEEKKTYKQRSQRAGVFSLSRVLGYSSLRVFGSTYPHASRMDFPAII